MAFAARDTFSVWAPATLANERVANSVKRTASRADDFIRFLPGESAHHWTRVFNGFYKKLEKFAVHSLAPAARKAIRGYPPL